MELLKVSYYTCEYTGNHVFEIFRKGLFYKMTLYSENPIAMELSCFHKVDFTDFEKVTKTIENIFKKNTPKNKLLVVTKEEENEKEYTTYNNYRQISFRGKKSLYEKIKQDFEADYYSGNIFVKIYFKTIEELKSFDGEKEIKRLKGMYEETNIQTTE